MNTRYSSYGDGLRQFNILCSMGRITPGTAIGNVILEGYNNNPSHLRMDFQKSWGDLANCYITQVAMEESMRFIGSSLSEEECFDFFKLGYTILSKVSAEKMARYMSANNPLFWSSIADTKPGLHSLIAA